MLPVRIVAATRLTAAGHTNGIIHAVKFGCPAHLAGNVGGWKAGATTSAVVREENASGFVYGSGWHTATSSSFLGGAARYASTAGADVARSSAHSRCWTAPVPRRGGPGRRRR